MFFLSWIFVESSRSVEVLDPAFRNALTFSEPSENFGTFRKSRKVPKISEGSENFGRFRKVIMRFGMQDQQPRRFWNILRISTIKKTSVSYIIFGMGPKTVLVVKNLPKFSEIWEDVPRFPRISEGFRNFRKIGRKGRSAYYTALTRQIVLLTLCFEADSG